MPANEFEKQVQQQLEQFQLNPSASVWKKVEENIRGEEAQKGCLLHFAACSACAAWFFFV
ncbi:MAG: hypothetical protein WDO16_23530 [Bacteroidota bacterium]